MAIPFEDILAKLPDDERREIELQPTLASENFQFLREAVLAGLGVGLVPDYVVQQDIETHAVVTCLNDWRLSVFGNRIFLLRMPGRAASLPASRTARRPESPSATRSSPNGKR